MIRILHLEDSPLDADLIHECLSKISIPYSLERVAARAPFIAAIERGGIDVILADYSLPDIDGVGALEIAREKAPETPFIFVSGVLGEEVAVESLKNGATDYVLKQRLSRLPATVERALAEARERVERRRAEERQSLLVAELSHRVKNTLTTVMSLAQQTLRRSDSLERFEAAFMGRLLALSEAHALLFERNWETTELSELIGRTLRPFSPPGPSRITLDGPDVALRPRSAVCMSLVLHELATNAAKYGALADGVGKIDVSWSVNGSATAPELLLNWTERDGRTVQPPAQRGFGSILIEQSVGYELDGEAKLDFLPAGVRCAIKFPLEEAPGALAIS